MSNPTETVSHLKYGTKPHTLLAYITGLVLSFFLTLAAFLLVGKQLLSNTSLFIAVAVLALLQFFVQAIFFLRLNADPEGRWNLYPFIFAIFVVIVLVAGSLWIMYNLNLNMQ